VFRIAINAKNFAFSFVDLISSKGLLYRAAPLGRRQRTFPRQDSQYRDNKQITGNKASLGRQRLNFQYSENYWSTRRFNASAISNLKSVCQDGRLEVKLINISKRGALIEGPESGAPRSRISLQLITDEEAYKLKGRIIRCHTFPMSDTFIKCRYAILFDEEFAALPELLI
jgi:hypothetical protein